MAAAPAIRPRQRPDSWATSPLSRAQAVQAMVAPYHQSAAAAAASASRHAPPCGTRTTLTIAQDGARPAGPTCLWTVVVAAAEEAEVEGPSRDSGYRIGTRVTGTRGGRRTTTRGPHRRSYSWRILGVEDSNRGAQHCLAPLAVAGIWIGCTPGRTACHGARPMYCSSRTSGLLIVKLKVPFYSVYRILNV